MGTGHSVPIRRMSISENGRVADRAVSPLFQRQADTLNVRRFQSRSRQYLADGDSAFTRKMPKPPIGRSAKPRVRSGGAAVSGLNSAPWSATSALNSPGAGTE